MGPGHGWPQWGKCRQISVPGEVVVLGEAQGNVDASERVNISSEGSLSGDV
jgi:cytoskeletal protein CcmA (bactofilin family)